MGHAKRDFMEKTITIKKIYPKKGTTKKGKPYTLIKLLADSVYYTTFQPKLVEGIKEGDTIDIIYDKGSREGYFTLLGIKADASPQGLSNAGRKGAEGAVQSTPQHLSLALPPLPKPLSLIELDALYNDMTDKYAPGMAEVMLRGQLQIQGQTFALGMAKRIEIQKKIDQENIAAVKRGRA
jgi:hypothetical protein